MSVEYEKAQCRLALAQRRKRLSACEHGMFSLLATEHLLSAPFWANTRSCALFLSTRGEIDTLPLIAALWHATPTIEVLIPFCSRQETGYMWMVPCTSARFLHEGRFGILEPDIPEEEAKRCAAIPSVMIIPGVGFASDGYRIGYGGGYYDRLLAQPEFHNVLRIGLCFSCQILDSLPHDSCDVPVHVLCSENGLTWVNQWESA